MAADRPANPQSMGATPTPALVKWRRRLLAVCIVLAPASFSLYVVSWTSNARQPLVASAAAGSTGNTLHFIGGVAASFFLPLGYLGMSLLGMRRAPGLATLAAALSLIGWIPWSALIAADDLASDVTRLGSTPASAALWTYFNGDVVLTVYLLIYIVGHLLGAVVIGYMLGRLRIVPRWAAWAFALTSPLTMLYFPIHNIVVENAIKYLICILWFVGAVPAALAMLHSVEDSDATASEPGS